MAIVPWAVSFLNIRLHAFFVTRIERPQDPLSDWQVTKVATQFAAAAGRRKSSLGYRRVYIRASTQGA